MIENPISKHLREQNKTQRQFAAELGAREASVSEWARDKVMPRPEMMQRMEVVTNGAIPVSAWFSRLGHRKALSRDYDASEGLA